MPFNVCSNASPLSWCDIETGRIDLEAAHTDVLQISLQGIELAKDSELLAALGGEGAFGQTIAH